VPAVKTAVEIEWSEFPERLRQETDQFLRGLTKVRKSRTGKRIRPLKASTIQTRRAELQAAARMAVKTGVPIDQLDSLSALLAPEVAEKPDIFNTDQGSQFTGTSFTGVLIKNAIAISMDGKGAWRDNVFVERLWRSVKYEEVYLRAYDSVSEARTSIGRYFNFYNGRRPHSSLDGMPPDQAYFTPLPLRTAA
jgi:transposase InsO family protein